MNWEDQPERILKITMSQRIAEIKRDYRKIPGQPCDFYPTESSIDKKIFEYEPSEKSLPDYMMFSNQNASM